MSGDHRNFHVKGNWTSAKKPISARPTPSVRSHAFSLRTAFLPLAGFAGSLLGGWLPGFLAGLRGLDPSAVGP